MKIVLLPLSPLVQEGQLKMSAKRIPTKVSESLNATTNQSTKCAMFERSLKTIFSYDSLKYNNHIKSKASFIILS